MKKMKKINTAFKPLLALCLLAAISSCNNNTEQAKDDPAKKEDSVTATPPVAAFKPFDVALVTHKVKDYAAWRPVFDADSANRKQNGMEQIVVARGADSPNNIMMAFKIADIQKAKDFAASPKLKESMKKAGVISRPDFEIFHVIRYNPGSKEKQWVDVTHKVKDFDAWLKVFDREGTATRADQGLIDVVLARNVDDSNTVHLVFDIKDMAKARARMNDPALKKIMIAAGVIGVPKIEFYTSAE